YGLVLAVLSGHFLWWQLCRRGAVVSFCCGRWGCASAACPGIVIGDGRRCSRRCGWSATCHLDDESMASLFVCCHFPDAGGGCFGLCWYFDGREAAHANDSRDRWRAAPARDRLPASFCGCSHRGRGVLSAHEFPDDVCATGHAYL